MPAAPSPGSAPPGAPTNTDTPHYDRSDRKHDDTDQDGIDVSGGEVRDSGDMSEKESEQDERGSPERSPDEVEDREQSPGHPSNAGSDGGKGADHRNESGERHRDGAESFEETLSARDASAAEEAGFSPVKDGRTGASSDDIAELVAESRCDYHEGDNQPERLNDHAAEHQHTGEEQQRIAGQKEPYEQPRFGEDDAADDGEPPHTSIRDDRLGVE